VTDVDPNDGPGVSPDGAGIADGDRARLLRLLGLGVRGRGAVVGVERVREAVERGTLALAIYAPDASRHSLNKVLPLLSARGIAVIGGPGAVELGHAVGRETTAVVGVTDPNLAAGIQQILGSSHRGGARAAGRARDGSGQRRRG
jgi:ribosomal protein L7Ae-like RNA K-turn-binding protein